MDSLKKNLYQLIIDRLDGNIIEDETYRKKIIKLAEKGIGGFILFGGSKEKIKRFISSIQSRAPMPLFIASDIEQGVGQQVKSCTVFPCQMAVTSAIDRSEPEDIKTLNRMLEAIADEAKDIGINMPLIPVLDINQNPDNPIICTRAFSDNSEDVSWFGSMYIEVLEKSGLMSCAKHFPGHGDTSEDSHIRLPVIRKSYNKLNKTDVVPFREAIKKGISSIMVGHLCIPAIDDNKPASLSKIVITSLLREDLGYKGLVITDALTMDALKGFENITVECIKAGADILLHPFNAEHAVEELYSGIKSKIISEKEIDSAFERILRFKQKLKTLVDIRVDYDEHRMISSHITDMSITLLKNTPGILPILEPGKLNFIYAGETQYFAYSPFKRFFKNTYKIGDDINLNERISIFAVFTSIAAWKGSSGIDEDEIEKIRALIPKSRGSIIISFGSPYMLRYFDESDVLVAAYEPTENAQEAVLMCLKGEKEFRGRFPVSSSFYI